MNIRNTIFASESPEMISAFNKAQETFKYFWRELSWEYRRIICYSQVEMSYLITK